MRRETIVDARRTGAFISRLRKGKDWTQLDLAEQLHVTNQAVSRWETGDSYPDITILPRLAELFSVTIDDLLNGEVKTAARPASPAGITPGEVLADLGQGRPERVAEHVREDPRNLDAVIEAAPLARPSMMSAVVEDLHNFHFTLEQISELAPFLGSDLLETLLLDTNLTQIDGELLSALAPFLSQDGLEKLVEKVEEGAAER